MKGSDTKLIRVIALFKLLKAVLLVLVGVGALKLLHMDIAGLLEEWVPRLGLEPGSRYVGRALRIAATLTPDKLKDLGVGSFIYAGLFFTEGIGLWLVKRWAEWLTVILTSSLVPVEVYEIVRHPTGLKGLLLIINLAVVAYLVYRLRSERSGLE
jgi:uncharacterized membrane protein (DUF2068 family)